MLSPTAATPLLAIVVNTITPSRQTHAAPGQLDVVMLSSFLTAFATMVCYVEMRRSNSHRMAFAIGLAAMAICGVLQGAWALSIVAVLWSVSTVRQWNEERQLLRLWNKPASRTANSPADLYRSESRITRLFGSDIDEERWNSAS